MTFPVTPAREDACTGEVTMLTNWLARGRDEVLVDGGLVRVRPAGRRGRAVRKVCAGCERHRALFRYHGVVKWDRFHTLCFNCYRAQRDRARADATVRN
jgi:hypothetical protein